jgi:hypothetical protein
LSDAQVFTPKDTAIVTPNSDTPYSMLQMDLRAEPIVICVPKVEKRPVLLRPIHGHVLLQLRLCRQPSDREQSGLLHGCRAGLDGDTPAGVKKVLRSETQFSLAIFRTQVFNAADIGNVKKIQAGYTAQTLSAFTHQPAPPVPAIPKFATIGIEAGKPFVSTNFPMRKRGN